ncbi:radical SAM family heme chaperone HemW [uncultured Tyzzerella sp.]|uniref:radical SAM family heme chaperone HemW n=1 Tax=uncultured Tyzzerella sp. TaxID=2321398 RepID=UPI002942110F|nr:radical SAM family heme chaperone HemW [uncultured Tyzzerella sp.]
MKDLSIYIHIPFCTEKCFYCDFLSFKGKEEYFEKYKIALIKEIEDFAILNKDKYIIKTIFIGGGTPSILPIGYIGNISEKIYKLFNVDKDIEFTIEANPGTLSYEKIKHFKASNINRISLGLQAYQNNLLKKIGRIHTIEDFLQNYENIRKVGFDNVNVDLMFSLPSQTEKDFEQTLNNITKLEPEHISTYSLILEEGTKFYSMYEKGEFELFSDEMDRKLYYMAIDILQKNGYNLYEISNFSKHNKQCRHNIVYWTRKEYIGFGLGSSSLIDEKRIVNTNNLNDYINFKNNREIEILEKKHMYSEFMFLGLRMAQGIKKVDFYNQFNIDIDSVYKKEIDKFIKNGLLIEEDGFLKLSKKGIDLSNVVFSEFI